MKTSLEGYVARNGTKQLMFFTNKPTRKREALLSDEELEKETLRNGQKKVRVWYPRKWEICLGKEISFKKLPFDDEVFKELKWEDEPIKVILTIESVE